MKTNIIGLTYERLRDEITRHEQPSYRAGQVFRWLHGLGASSFSEMSNLPGRFKEELADRFGINSFLGADEFISKDGTRKFLILLSDKNYIEAVIIPSTGRNTICISTQVGCKFHCAFCASGSHGFKRNLETAEIVEQVHLAVFRKKIPVNNIVFMGMGEPLDNYENLEDAIRIFNHRDGLNIAARKMTISTCGIVPGIHKLADIGLQVRLSISLHAVSDSLRSRLMPVNRIYPISELVSACKMYCEKTGRRITIEYALIRGVNDSETDAAGLAKIARSLNANVNLIKCSKIPWLDFFAPDKIECHRFADILRKKCINVVVRRPRGEDIMAACGQLAGERANKSDEI